MTTSLVSRYPAARPSEAPVFRDLDWERQYFSVPPGTHDCRCVL